MDVLQRIENMQKELSVKIDRMSNCSKFSCLDGADTAMKFSESLAVDDAQQEAAENNVDKPEVRKRLNRQQYTWADEEDFTIKHASDLQSRYAVMGWKKSLSAAFAVNESDD